MTLILRRPNKLSIENGVWEDGEDGGEEKFGSMKESSEAMMMLKFRLPILQLIAVDDELSKGLFGFEVCCNWGLLV